MDITNFTGEIPASLAEQFGLPKEAVDARRGRFVKSETNDDNDTTFDDDEQDEGENTYDYEAADVDKAYDDVLVMSQFYTNYLGIRFAVDDVCAFMIMQILATHERGYIAWGRIAALATIAKNYVEDAVSEEY